MEINHDESYLYLNSDMERVGFTNKTIQKICFQGYAKDFEKSKTAIQTIKDRLENHYKMYQYKKDNGVKYGEHELFYWSNGENLYFDVSLNEKYSVEYNQKIVDEILDYVNQEHSDVQGEVSLQYELRTDWNKVNKYVQRTEFDINNLPYGTLNAISNAAYCQGDTLTIESRNKLYNIEQQLMNAFKDKKVVYKQVLNGMFGKTETTIKGTLKQINENVYGVFKPRATKTYYKINMRYIKNLRLA